MPCSLKIKYGNEIGISLKYACNVSLFMLLVIDNSSLPYIEI